MNKPKTKVPTRFGGDKAPPRGPGGRPKVVGHIRDLAREHTEDAFRTIIELMKSSDHDGTRLAAAQELLNRGYGKAPQTMAGEDGEGLPELVIKWLDGKS
jgi:hypothetical protein